MKQLQLSLLLLMLLQQATPALERSSYTPARIRANALFFKGMDLRKEKQYRPAIARIRQAIKIDPTNGLYPFWIGRIHLYRLREYKKAIPFYRQAVRLMPANPWPLTELAIAMHRAKAFPEAASTFRMTLDFFKKRKRRPLFRIYEGLGRILRDKLKQPAAALQIFREGFQFYPARTDLLLESAKCLADLGRKQASLRQCRRAIRLARRHYLRVPYWIDWKIGRVIRRRLKEPKTALAHLYRAIRRNPDKPFLKMQIGYCWNDRKRYGKTARWYIRALRQYKQLGIKHSIWYYFYLTDLLRRKRKQPKLALKWLQEAVSIYGNHPDVFSRMGHANGMLRQYKMQIHYYNRYIHATVKKNRKPGIHVHYWIADILRGKMKQPEKSLQYLKKVIPNFPDDAGLQERLGHAHGVLKQYKKQITAYREYIRLRIKKGKKPGAWRLCSMGDILRSRLKQPTASVKLLNWAIRIYPKYAGLPVRLGNAYGVLKEYKKQLDAYLAYIKLTVSKKKKPSKWVLLHCSNILRKHLHNPKGALVFINRQVQHHPRYWQLPWHRALAYEALERWDRAALELQQAIRLRKIAGLKIPGWLLRRHRRALKNATAEKR